MWCWCSEKKELVLLYFVSTVPTVSYTHLDVYKRQDLDDAPFNPTCSNVTMGLKRIPFTKVNGLLVNNPGNNKPTDWFLLLLDNNFLEKVCLETNKYPFEVYCGPTTSEKS